jgi:hypothetical protein
MPDERALKILFNTYWGKDGWKDPPAKPSPDDLAYATAAGVMFPPRDLKHDELIRDIVRLREQIPPRAVADAFLASLSTRRLELRSALASYAVARHLPPHKFTKSKVFNYDTCGICGDFNKPWLKFDVDRFNFDRFKWGGVEHEMPHFIAFDLEWFLQAEPLKPTEEDRGILREILRIAGSGDPKLTPGKLEKEINVLPSSKDERRALLEILGQAGVLQPKDRPGYFKSFVTRDELEEADSDWHYPVCWWRGSDGVNQQAVKFWWPKL